MNRILNFFRNVARRIKSRPVLKRAEECKVVMERQKIWSDSMEADRLYFAVKSSSNRNDYEYFAELFLRSL